MKKMKKMKKIISAIFLGFLIISGVSCIDDSGYSSGFPRAEPDIPDSQPTDWLIMAYLAGDNNLAFSMAMDIEWMMSANMSGQSRVRVVVLADHDGKKDTYLFKILRHGVEYLTCKELGINGLSPGEVDTGDPNILSKFIDFAKSKYNASHYALFIGGHGDGWRSKSTKKYRAIASDDTSKSVLSNHNLQIAVKNKGINLIALDSCLMAMVETAYELRKSVTGIDYLVSSQEVTTGYPYGPILNRLIKSTDFSPSEFAKIITNEFIEYYPANSRYTQSAVDLSKIENVVTALDPFIGYLNTLNAATLDNARGNTESYYLAQYVDLYHFSENFSDTSDTSAVALRSAITNAVLISKSGLKKPFAKGLSINFTTINHDADYDEELNANIDFLGDSGWDEFLHSKRFGYTKDPDEPGNDTPGVLIVNKDVTLNGYTIDTKDKDYYTLTVTAPGSIEVRLTELTEFVDLDLYLYKDGVIEPVAMSISGKEGDNETLILNNAVSGATYHLLVLPYLGMNFNNPYKISFTGSAVY